MLLLQLLLLSAVVYSDWWVVTSGSCQVTGTGGNCITSPNYPSNYNNNDQCSFEVGQKGQFNMEDFTIGTYDDLMWKPAGTSRFVRRSYYTLQNNAHKMHMTPGSNGDKFTWQTNSAYTRKGWKFCLTPERSDCTGTDGTAAQSTRCTGACLHISGWWGRSYCWTDGYQESAWGAECGPQWCPRCMPSATEKALVWCSWYKDSCTTETHAYHTFIMANCPATCARARGECDSPYAAETAEALEYVSEDSTIGPQDVVVYAFAALGVAVIAYGAFRYYTKKSAEYQQIQV